MSPLARTTPDMRNTSYCDADICDPRTTSKSPRIRERWRVAAARTRARYRTPFDLEDVATALRAEGLKLDADLELEDSADEISLINITDSIVALFDPFSPICCASPRGKMPKTNGVDTRALCNARHFAL